MTCLKIIPPNIFRSSHFVLSNKRNGDYYHFTDIKLSYHVLNARHGTLFFFFSF